MAYSILVSGQLIGKTQDSRQVNIESDMVVLERRELCSGSLFKQGSYDYFYYFAAKTTVGTFKWLVKVSSGQEQTLIHHSHLYKSPKDMEIEQDVQFLVSEVTESSGQHKVNLEAS